MKCRHCQQDMYIHSIQEYPAKYNLVPLTLIECHNPGCKLWMQTYNKATYATKDLTPYLKGKRVK
jgi:hypothetical protein